VEGKKLQYLAKRGWRIVGEIAGNSDWLGIYEKIRTEFTKM
jgi:hypothetical protein